MKLEICTFYIHYKLRQINDNVKLLKNYKKNIKIPFRPSVFSCSSASGDKSKFNG